MASTVGLAATWGQGGFVQVVAGVLMVGTNGELSQQREALAALETEATRLRDQEGILSDELMWTD